jgi:hypothetical protein
MVLFSIEYEISNGQSGSYLCRCIGENENDVYTTLCKYCGGRIKIISLYRVSEVHLITDTIRNKIIENRSPTKKKMGRPRLPDE